KKEELRIKNLIDIGTGCGCIIVVLAKKLPLLGINFYGLDISRQALSVARQNAQKHKVEKDIKFIKSDLLREIFKQKISPGPTIITANLPYLTAEQIAASPSIKKEPRLALIGGSDGLDCYRRLFSQIKNHRHFFKGELLIFCEIDDSQSRGMTKLVEQGFPSAKLEIKKDYSGFDRLAVIKI
ncbi:MAG TPA: HemK family protein methyltransferase, partial [Candidatus Methylomirabilis sp.]|nr:HemK family protein methyltransferase [Candidatus Methylomirabilis sp.]